MVLIQSYPLAVLGCLLTMLCWGSWANTQKLAGREWRFELFYWDYAIGVFLLASLMALTMGSLGSHGRPFLEDLAQADGSALVSAFLGGVIFNAANILLVAAIAIAGMAVAFPVGIGLALVLGVLVNYVATPLGNPVLLFSGVLLVVAAIGMDAAAYRGLAGEARKLSARGLILSLCCGVLMGFFYRFVARSMSTDFSMQEMGRMGPYAAVWVFSVGLLVSNLVFNTLVMRKPFVGKPVRFSDYLQGSLLLHGIGVLGGVVWGIGMGVSILASGPAGFAISYGLGQGATLVAAVWGVFIWKEFSGASARVRQLIVLMFVAYVVGLSLIIGARMV